MSSYQQKFSKILEQGFLKVKAKELVQGAMPRIADSVTISEVAKRMRDEGSGSLLLRTAASEELSLITERDVLKAAAANPENVAGLGAKDFATAPVETLSGRASFARVLFLMATGRFRTLPIVDTDSDEVLKLTSRDVVRRLYKQLAMERVNEQDEARVIESDLEDFFESTVSELQYRNAQSAELGAPLVDCLKLMNEKGFGSMLVTEGNKLRGIFTERDLVHRVLAEDRGLVGLRINDVMTKSPSTILEGSSVSLAFGMMADGGFRHIPVVNELEELQGLVSVRNFIEVLSTSIMQELEEAAKEQD